MATTRELDYSGLLDVKLPCQRLLEQDALHGHCDLDLVYLFGYYHQVV